MMQPPQDTPRTAREAFAHIATVKTPSINDLKLMALLEAVSKVGYDAMAAAAPNPAAGALLARNGQEELAHAYRVKEVIRLLTSEDYPIPEGEQNPYYEPANPPVVTASFLARLADTETAGEALYEQWAQGIGNDAAAALLRQNGREELGHAARLRQAAALLEDASTSAT